MPLAGVILDFDGTMTEPFIDWEALRQEVGEINTPLVLEYVRTLTDAIEKSRIESILFKYESEARDNAKPREGIYPLIDGIKARGLKYAVVTNNTHNNVKICLENFGIEPDAIVSRDDNCFKPNPEPIVLATKKLGVSINEVILIGDAWPDIMAAQAAGCPSIRIVGETSIPIEVKPTHNINHLNEVLAIIDQHYFI